MTIERSEAQSIERPRNIVHVQQLEESLAVTSSSSDPIQLEAKQNLLNYWKVYFVGQYRHAYEHLYIGLQRSGQISELLALESFRRDGRQQPLQRRESDLVGDFIGDAKEAKHVLDGLVASIVEEQPELEIQAGPVKNEKRAMLKAKENPDGLRALTDYARTSVICSTAHDLKKVHDWFVEKRDPQVVDVPLVRNTFRGNYQPNGYRDIKLIVELGLGDDSSVPRRTHLCEVQLHFKPFFSLKEGNHKIYEWARELQVRHRMDPQQLFKGMRSELLDEMIRLAQEDWSGLRRFALADLLTTARRHDEAGALLQEMFDDAFDRVRDAVDAGETPEIHFVEGFLRAANELSLNCCVRGAYKKAEELAELAMSCTGAGFGEGYSALSTTYCNLASTEYMKGNLERARELAHKAVQLSSGVGSQHPQYATDMNNLALVLWKLGEMDDAEAMLRTCARIQRRFGEYDTEREDCPDTIPTTVYADAISNLAVFLRSKGGHEEESGDLYEEALAIKRSVRGETHPDVAMALSNLGNYVLSRGDERRAIQLLTEATSILDQHTENMAQGDADWAVPYENLGEILRKKGQLSRAHVHFRKVLDMRARCDSVHPFVDTLPLIATHVAEFLMMQNNLPEAELVFKQALGILGRNPQVPGVQMAMAAGLNNLSIAQMQQGHFSEALATKQAGYAKELQELSPGHPQLLKSRQALHLLTTLSARAQYQR